MRQHPPPLRRKSPFSARNCLNLGLFRDSDDPNGQKPHTPANLTPLQTLPDPKTFPRHSQDAPSPKTKATLSGMHTNPQQHPKYFTPQTPHPLTDPCQTSAQTLQTPHRPLPNPSQTPAKPLPDPFQEPCEGTLQIVGYVLFPPAHPAEKYIPKNLQVFDKYLISI